MGRLWVGPPWEDAPPGALTVVIDSARAFGTGAHATTRLCLELLSVVPGGSLLDVGCGSGVLAIAGAKLGFAPVSAIDVDPVAVDATLRNAMFNNVAIVVKLADGLSDALPEADVAVANLTLDSVTAISQLVRASLLVTCGYLAADELALEGWERRDRREADGWAADLWAPIAE